MKKFYKFICDLHLIDYTAWLLIIGILVDLYENNYISSNLFSFMIYAFIGLAFMNTWVLEAKNKNLKGGEDK